MKKINFSKLKRYYLHKLQIIRRLAFKVNTANIYFKEKAKNFNKIKQKQRLLAL